MVRRALEVTIAGAAGVAARKPEAVASLFDALVLSGLAMGMIGNSRPASGAEHHLSHYWEMDALKNHEAHALHGNAVGSATVAIARTYELMRDLLPAGFVVPDSAEIRTWLTAAGSKVTPAELGISRELFHRSMLEAMHVRPRFTILRFAADQGRLASIAEQVTREFYA
jgi:glycerol-1-phosphate dehydrogenase [NAD(P)+]